MDGTRADAGRHRAHAFLSVMLAVAALPALAMAAGPRFWDWPDGRSFGEVTLTGAGFDTLGGLVAGPAVSAHELDGPEVAWRLAADGRGGWYAGTGHAGEIHHLGADGSLRLLARLESTEVFSLAVLPGGDVLAGGGPDGRLARVTAGGDVTEVGRIEGGYIWAMAVQEKAGIVWLATGSPAAVYSYRWRDGKLESVATLPAQNAMDVMVDDDRGRLLVTTQGPGLVYALAGGGAEVRLLGDIAQDEARRLLRGAGGAVHVLGLAGGAEARTAVGEAGSEGGEPAGEGGSGGGAPANGAPDAPAAALYCLDCPVDMGDEVAPRRVWAGDRDLMAAVWSDQWGWLGAGTLAGGGGPGGIMPAAESPGTAAQSVLLKLTQPWGAVPLTTWTGGDVLDLAVADGPGRGTADGELALAQAHPAAVLVARAGRDGGQAVGPPLDGGPGVSWGRLRWEGVAGQGEPRWSVRGGRRAQPDETWTDWSAPWGSPDHELRLAGCRYLQWRVELPAADAGKRGWRVTGVSVSARQPNLPPVIEEFRLEQLRGVRLGGLSAGESIVHEYRSGLRAEFTTQEAPSEGWGDLERSDPGRAVRVLTWRASDPNGDRLGFRLECRAIGESAWWPAAAAGGQHGVLTGNLGSWDTSALPDGRYELRLLASDEPDNPRAAMARCARVLGPVTVDNTPPRLEVLEAGMAADVNAYFVRLRALDATSPLAGARVVLPDGSAERLDPRDGICDTGEEVFLALVDRSRCAGSEAGRPVRLRLEVRDLAGNLAGIEAVVP